MIKVKDKHNNRQIKRHNKQNMLQITIQGYKNQIVNYVKIMESLPVLQKNLKKEEP